MFTIVKVKCTPIPWLVSWPLMALYIVGYRTVCIVPVPDMKLDNYCMSPPASSSEGSGMGAASVP